MLKIPPHIQILAEERQKLREHGMFGKADKIREEILRKGYRVADLKNRTVLSKIPISDHITPKHSYMVLFGSGEISHSGARIHEYVFSRMEKDNIRVAIITTPAGFQPNVKTVYEEIAEFFLVHLKNYHPQVSIIYANTRKEANNRKILKDLERSDYIFTGPGSPTYAIKHLRNTLLIKEIKERVKKGASLSLASAATIAFSRFALPVYEIYKAGAPLSWEEGLNFYARFFEQLTIVPHYNNKEGGTKTDTSRCFMGRTRFKKLLSLLPPKEKVWGIDEHTAAVIDLATKQCLVMGKEKVHVGR